MAGIELTVTIDISAGMKGGWIVIDTTDVPITNGKGKKSFQPGEHRYHCYFAGPPGGTCTYEIKRGEEQVVKSITRTILDGERTGRSVGGFTLV